MGCGHALLAAVSASKATLTELDLSECFLGPGLPPQDDSGQVSLEQLLLSRHPFQSAMNESPLSQPTRSRSQTEGFGCRDYLLCTICRYLWDLEPVRRIAVTRPVQGYFAQKKQPPPLGPPQVSRQGPTVGSQGGAVSHELGTPVYNVCVYAYIDVCMVNIYPCMSARGFRSGELDG